MPTVPTWHLQHCGSVRTWDATAWPEQSDAMNTGCPIEVPKSNTFLGRLRVMGSLKTVIGEIVQGKRGKTQGVTQMSWETRNGRGRYYTRSWRVGGRIVREYIGCESEAALVAELDRQEREIRRLEAERKETQRTQDATLDAHIDEISELANLLARGLLLIAGFHDHRGEWRRNRGKTEKPGYGR